MLETDTGEPSLGVVQGNTRTNARLVSEVREANNALAATLREGTPELAVLCKQASVLVAAVQDLLKDTRFEPAGLPGRLAGVQAEGRLQTSLVLIVDDNQDAAELLASLVEHLGYQAMIAHDGASALGLVRERRPDVALLDIGLPVMNGYELAAHLRADPSLQKLRILAITGYGQPEDLQRAAAAGFDAHLLKPLDANALAKLLTEI